MAYILGLSIHAGFMSSVSSLERSFLGSRQHKQKQYRPPFFTTSTPFIFILLLLFRIPFLASGLRALRCRGYRFHSILKFSLSNCAVIDSVVQNRWTDGR